MKIISKDRTLELDVPKIMGILNVTPDSFSDGGSYMDPNKALDHAAMMMQDGAAVIDIGGESTRPGAASVRVDEELARVIPTVEKIAANLDVMISVDTSSPEVIKEACRAGAHFWNDVRALSQEGAIQTALELDIPVCIMHMQGNPETMQKEPCYQDVVSEVKAFLEEKTLVLLKEGIKPWNIIWDVGFGFGKSVADNYLLLAKLNDFTAKGFIVLAGLSRKSMIGTATSRNVPKDRISGSVAAALIAAQKGAMLLRVHDVRETSDALKIWQKVKDCCKEC